MIFEKLCALIAEQFNVDADTITMETSFAEDVYKRQGRDYVFQAQDDCMVILGSNADIDRLERR